MDEVRKTVTRCALLIEVEGEILQAYLSAEQSIQLLNFATGICGGKLQIGDRIESIALSEPTQ